MFPDQTILFECTGHCPDHAAQRNSVKINLRLAEICCRNAYKTFLIMIDDVQVSFPRYDLRAAKNFSRSGFASAIR